MRKAQQTRSLVAAWFDFLPPTELAAAQAVHRALRVAAGELTETIRQGNLLLLLNGEPLLAIAPGRNQVELVIFNGRELEAELGPLEGVSRRQRVLKFDSADAVDEAQVGAIARASIAQARRAQALPGH